jgi:hypothetical protein
LQGHKEANKKEVTDKVNILKSQLKFRLFGYKVEFILGYSYFVDYDKINLTWTIVVVKL